MDLEEVRLHAQLKHIKRREESLNYQITADRWHIAQNTDIGFRLAAALQNEMRHETQLEIDQQLLWNSSPITVPFTSTRTTAVQPLAFFRRCPVPEGRLCWRLVTETEIDHNISSIDIKTISGKGICIMCDSILRVYEPVQGKCFADWNTRADFAQNCVKCVTIFRDHPDLLFFGSEDGYIRLLDLKIVAIVEEWPAHSDSVIFLDTRSLDGRAIMVSGTSTELAVWDGTTLQEICRTTITSPVISCTETNNELVVRTAGGAFIVNLETGELEETATPQEAVSFRVDICETGVKVTAGDDSMILRTDRRVECVDYNGNYVAAACGRIVYIWEVGHCGR